MAVQSRVESCLPAAAAGSNARSGDAEGSRGVYPVSPSRGSSGSVPRLLWSCVPLVVASHEADPQTDKEGQGPRRDISPSGDETGATAPGTVPSARKPAARTQS